MVKFQKWLDAKYPQRWSFFWNSDKYGLWEWKPRGEITSVYINRLGFARTSTGTFSLEGTIDLKDFRELKKLEIAGIDNIEDFYFSFSKKVENFSRISKEWYCSRMLLKFHENELKWSRHHDCRSLNSEELEAVEQALKDFDKKLTKGELKISPECPLLEGKISLEIAFLETKKANKTKQPAKLEELPVKPTNIENPITKPEEPKIEENLPWTETDKELERRLEALKTKLTRIETNQAEPTETIISEEEKLARENFSHVFTNANRWALTTAIIGQGTIWAYRTRLLWLPHLVEIGTWTWPLVLSGAKSGLTFILPYFFSAVVVIIGVWLIWKVAHYLIFRPVGEFAENQIAKLVQFGETIDRGIATVSQTVSQIVPEKYQPSAQDGVHWLSWFLILLAGWITLGKVVQKLSKLMKAKKEPQVNLLAQNSPAIHPEPIAEPELKKEKKETEKRIKTMKNANSNILCKVQCHPIIYLTDDELSWICSLCLTEK